MEAENVQGRKTSVKGGGRCIYCGAVDRLGDEHVVAYSLGGNTILLKASCARCGAITSYLEGYLANATFGHLRVHSGVQSRSGHPELLSATVELADGERVIDLTARDHPFFLHMPVWHVPEIFTGRVPSSEFPNAKAHVYWFLPNNIRQSLGMEPSDVARVVDTTPMPNIGTFARAIAKIAYCQTVFRYGLDGFRSIGLPDVILGNNPNISFFVGSSLNDPPPPEKQGVLHTVSFSEYAVRNLKLIVCSVRLFAHSGTEAEGMPIYYVATGALGATKAVTQRTELVVPRVISL
jgi:hypothetical protein